MDQLRIEGTENVPVLPIGETEARELTDRIKGKAEELWHELLEAYEREAWKALGYTSWGEYCKNEFGYGDLRGYRLINAAMVDRAIESASFPRETEQRPTERQARELAQLAKKNPEAAAEAWEEAVKEYPETKEHPEKRTAEKIKEIVERRFPKAETEPLAEPEPNGRNEPTGPTVGEALTGAIEAGDFPDIPSKYMSESQKQGYKAAHRYYALCRYDPEEVAKAHDPAKNREIWSDEVERTHKVMSWFERYLDALHAIDR